MFNLNLGGNVAFAADKQASQAWRAPLKILIVEDDEADAYLIKRLLAEHPRIGKVVRAIDGVDALAMLNVGVNPDLAFIDLHMPRMNGIALVGEIGHKGFGFPMIVLTSAKTVYGPVRDKLRRVDQILSKPHTVDGYRRVLAAAIDEIGAA